MITAASFPSLTRSFTTVKEYTLFEVVSPSNQTKQVDSVPLFLFTKVDTFTSTSYTKKNKASKQEQVPPISIETEVGNIKYTAIRTTLQRNVSPTDSKNVPNLYSDSKRDQSCPSTNLFFVPPAIKNNVILSQRLYVLTFLELKESSGFSMNFVFPNNTEARIFFFKWMILLLAWCLSHTEQVCSHFFPSISRVLPLAMLGLLDYFAFLEVGHFASIPQHPPKPDLECKKMAHPFNLSYNYPPIVPLLATNKK